MMKLKANLRVGGLRLRGSNYRFGPRAKINFEIYMEGVLERIFYIILIEYFI
jgi:hypothetical protein